MRICREHWSLIAALAVLLVAIVVCLLAALRQNDGLFVYALDDPYIHLAIAKNLAQYGVWGVTQYEFSPASSSLLWTLLLASLFSVWGVNELTPFVLNVVCLALVVVQAYLLLSKRTSRQLTIFAVLSLSILVAPLPALAFTGQEHSVHILLSTAFLYSVYAVLLGQKATGSQLASCSVLAALLVMARYEGLFLLLVTAGLLLWQRKPRYALLLAGAGLLPVLAFGFVSLANGGYLVPNPVILKAGASEFSGLSRVIRLVLRGPVQLLLNSPMLVVVAGGLIVLRSEQKTHGVLRSETGVLTAILVPVACLHLALARLGSLFRYEAYLVWLGVLVLALPLSRLLRSELQLERGAKRTRGQSVLALSSVLMLLALVLRGADALAKTPRATSNIYRQQYQMALFLKEFYRGDSIAVNDIGAVSYYAGVKTLDLRGLASMDVARARVERRYDSSFINDLARSRGTKVAIVFDEWFENLELAGIPSEWFRAGEWAIENNVVCGDDVVTFYAVDPAEEDDLISNLQRFSDRLPEGAFQTGAYMRH